MSSEEKKKGAQPKLRFPEFRDAGQWEVKRLGEICRITNGSSNAQDHDNNGIYPLFDRSEIVKKSSKYLFDCEAVIIPGEGTSFVPKYYIGKFDLHQRAYALMDFAGCGRFIYYQMDALKNQLAKKAVMSTVLSLRIPILEKFMITFPPLPEQQKIADCLSSLDELIELQTKKLEALKAHKKGLMQKLFPREGETIPRLRFPEFRDAGPWEVKKLGTYLERKPEYGINAPAVPYSDDLPTYLRITDISEDGKYLKENKVSVDVDIDMGMYLSVGDIVLARTGASVGKSYKYRKEDGKLVFAGFLVRIRPDAKRLNSEFLFQYLYTDRYWRWVVYTSVRSGQPGINGSEYASMPIPLPPTLSEQQKIAECLSSLDELIEFQTKKVEALKAHKKGLMQQLFPREME